MDAENWEERLEGSLEAPGYPWIEFILKGFVWGRRTRWEERPNYVYVVERTLGDSEESSWRVREHNWRWDCQQGWLSSSTVIPPYPRGHVPRP